MAGPRSNPNQQGTTPKGKAKAGIGGEQPKLSLAKELARFEEFQSGLQLNIGYKLGSQISAGAEGDVFCVSTASSPRGVAAKRMRIGNAANQRHALQEVSAVFFARTKHGEEVGDESSLGHPNIVNYLDWFAGSGGLDREVWIVMERCEFALSNMVQAVGQVRSQYERRVDDLTKSVKNNPSGQRPPGPDPSLYRFQEKEVVKVMNQMLIALAFLNRQRIMHRDVKADNILWLPGNIEGVYKLADFGTAACLAEGETSRRSDDCGTLWIMAPELLGRRPHWMNCDVWSLGVTLFEMAFFEKPFNSKELLTYRATQEATVEGSFWPAMCINSNPVAQAAAKLAAMPAVPASPARGKLNRKATAPLPSPSNSRPKLERPASTGSLPNLESRHHGERGSPSSPSSGSGVRSRRNAPSLLPLLTSPSEPSSPVASKSGAFELEPATPTSPVSPSSQADSLRSSKNTYLRKRAALRWSYGEALRRIIVEDMLEEDISLRLQAATLLENQRYESLLAEYGKEDSFLGATADAKVTVETAAASVAAGANSFLAQSLKRVSAELFFLAMTTEQNAKSLQGPE